jgi:hypothetical protein
MSDAAFAVLLFESLSRVRRAAPKVEGVVPYLEEELVFDFMNT